MPISLTSIQEGTIKTLNDLLGKNAPIQRQLFTSPVIKTLTSKTRLSYPIVCVNKVLMSQYGNRGVVAEYINDNEHFEQITNYKAVLNIDVRGDSSHDVELICREIRDTLYRQYGYEALQENTQAGLLSISPVSFSYNYLHTEYEEVAKITVSFSVADTFVDDDPTLPSTGCMDSTTISGELTSPDASPPLPVTTTPT